MIANEPSSSRGRGVWWRGPLGITALFAALAGVMTWPQAALLQSHAYEHHDVFFNLWRLRWIAHALATSPADLFNANVFYPERGVLAYSDAMLVQGTLAAPLLWAGTPPVLVHNLMLLAGIVGSAVGAFVLARHLTGSSPGAVVAGAIFAFAPYRFEHYMHMELQWAVWSPWAFWALQRTLETASMRFGLLMGLFAALQMASSIYYGMFLLMLLAVVGLLQLGPLRGRQLVRAAGAAMAGAALAASLSWLYSQPYSAAASRVGTRSNHEVRTFSARPRDYGVAPSTNVLYGSPVGRPERRLFPGIVPPVLAVVGLLFFPLTTAAIAYLTGLAVAFELSLGAHGLLYPFLYTHFDIVHGLRAPARASVFFLLFLGVLTAYAIAALSAAMPRRIGRAFAVAVFAMVLLEYRVGRLPLVAYPNEPPPLYQVLARQPPGVVIEFPLPRPGQPPFLDPRYAYLSTFHWMPMLNGYSGFFPDSYLRRLHRLARFPDEESVASLRRESVKYVIVHDDGYPQGERLRVVERLLQLGLNPVAEQKDGWGTATLLVFP